ncbi:BQ5605_C040g11862 [Microbotryum silenes-dioicae]|uniref:BQ5605_C040g11862 protein n=1 Tax=Microbotryum silenes-dioicae TaxID=796604 RepID=A0A2X0PQ67_9BASI|nr:BQ5605_C040g11862 [Microbotryum silenes-dioicae]
MRHKLSLTRDTSMATSLHQMFFQTQVRVGPIQNNIQLFGCIHFVS